MEFEQLRDTINQMMTDFEGNLRGGQQGGLGQGRQGRRRRGSQGLNEWPGMGGGFFPSQQWGGGFFDDAFDVPMLGGVGVGGPLQQQLQKGGKGAEEMKSMETDQPQQITQLGGQAQRATQLQPSQPGQLMSTFKPQQIMRAKCNVEELPDKFVVTAELPGFDKANVKINVSDDGLLSIKGEQTKEWVDQSKNKNYCLAERSFANIQRTLRIPKGVDCNKIAASYENGVLHVNLPKNPEEASKSKQEIQIQ